MPEMPHAGEHHGDAVIVGGLDDFIVTYRTARLDHGGGAGLDAANMPSANGKNASDATTEPLVSGSASFSSVAASCALRAAIRAESTRLIWPGADTDGGEILRVDDRVRLDVLGDAECKFEIAQFGVRRRTLGQRSSTSCRRPRHCRGFARACRLRRFLRSGPRCADRVVRPPAAAANSSAPATMAMASSVASGAMITSVKISVMARAASASSVRLSATIPP